jgi:hypothetical protein
VLLLEHQSRHTLNPRTLGKGWCETCSILLSNVDQLLFRLILLRSATRSGSVFTSCVLLFITTSRCSRLHAGCLAKLILVIPGLEGLVLIVKHMFTSNGGDSSAAPLLIMSMMQPDQL